MCPWLPAKAVDRIALMQKTPNKQERAKGLCLWKVSHPRFPVGRQLESRSSHSVLQADREGGRALIHPFRGRDWRPGWSPGTKGPGQRQLSKLSHPASVCQGLREGRVGEGAHSQSLSAPGQ